MGLYKLIDNINNNNLFKYVIVIFLSIIYFKNKSIGLNIIIALICAAFYISYNYDEIETTKKESDQIKEIKINNIQPDPTNFKDRDDVIDLLFSVQDWYHHNPQSYEEMIYNLQSFFDLYKAIKRGSKFCDQYFQIAESKKNNAINAYHSLVFNLPVNSDIMDKFNRSHKRFETLMNGYLNELYDICTNDLRKNGYNVTRKAINIGPKEANHYFDKDYTYQFY
jgi:hypothetical protein